MKYNVRFFIQSPQSALDETTKSGKLVMRVRWDHKKKEVGIFTQMYANPDKWDTEHQTPMKNTTHIHNGVKVSAADMRLRINKYLQSIEECFEAFDREQHVPTTTELKSSFYDIIGIEDVDKLSRLKKGGDDVLELEKKVKSTLLDYFDAFMEYGKLHNRWSIGTIQKFLSLRKHIHDYGRMDKLENVNSATLDRFVQHLVNQGARNVSIQGSVKKIKQFFKWCDQYYSSLVKDKNILTFKCKLSDIKEKTVIFLTKEEYYKLKNCYIPKEREVLKKVRNLFLFQCNTGLRYSDVFKLKKTDIINGEIFITTKKTSKGTGIYLNKTSQEILDYYKDFPFKDNKALPVMSNQKYNKFLQEVCRLAGITTPTTITYRVGEELRTETKEKYKLVGSHCGRRTFVSLALAYGATPEEIMHVTGHSCYNAMKPYIGQDDEQRRHATSVFDKQDEKERIIKSLEKLPIDELKKLLKETRWK